MNSTTPTSENQKRSLAQNLLYAVAWCLASILPLYFLLFTGFIIFVPLLAFFVWLLKQCIRRRLRTQWKTGIALFVVSIALSVFMGWGMFRSTRRPDRYLIPQGYVGWIIVEYNVKGAPPLPQEDGHDLCRIPRDGRLQTSSPFEDGSARDEYYYIGAKGRQKLEWTGWGEGGLIWGGSTSDGSMGVGDNKGTRTVYTPPTQTWFIGTEKQFQTAGAAPHSKEMQKRIDAI